MSRHVGRASAWEAIPAGYPVPDWYYRSYDVTPMWARLEHDGSVLVADYVRAGGGYERVVRFTPRTLPPGTAVRVLRGDRSDWEPPHVLEGEERFDALAAHAAYITGR